MPNLLSVFNTIFHDGKTNMLARQFTIKLVDEDPDPRKMNGYRYPKPYLDPSLMPDPET